MRTNRNVQYECFVFCIKCEMIKIFIAIMINEIYCVASRKRKQKM